MTHDKIIIAQWLARRFATGEVPGTNPGKGEYIFRLILILFSYMTRICGIVGIPTDISSDFGGPLIGLGRRAINHGKLHTVGPS